MNRNLKSRKDSSRNIRPHSDYQQLPLLRLIQMISVIAIPVALQNLLTTTGSMVDTIMLASLGERTVGAAGLCALLGLRGRRHAVLLPVLRLR